MSMDYKELFALVKGILLGNLKGEPVNTGSLSAAIHKVELAIDAAIISGKPINELEDILTELRTIYKAVWYAHRGE